MPDKNKKQTADSVPPNPLVTGLHFRGKLPHLKKEGAVYFVTFRLADSLTAHEVARLKHERKVTIEQARAAKSPLTWHEEQELLAWYCARLRRDDAVKALCENHCEGLRFPRIDAPSSYDRPRLWWRPANPPKRESPIDLSRGLPRVC